MKRDAVILSVIRKMLAAWPIEVSQEEKIVDNSVITTVTIKEKLPF